MFSPRTRPLALDAERLVGLRLSLNTPVVATPELPAGPARAALVSHLESGVRCIAVAVRSLRNGATVLYELEGMSLDATTDFSVALDAALSFAESMGFLFDDDEMERGGDEAAAHALRRWREMIGPAAARIDLGETGATQPPAAPTSPRQERRRRRLEAELLLEDVAEETVPEFELPGEPASESGADPEGALPAPRAGGTLTKFRAPSQTESAAPETERQPAGADPGATALGRVRLVRRRAPADSGRGSPLLRLLACF